MRNVYISPRFHVPKMNALQTEKYPVVLGARKICNAQRKRERQIVEALLGWCKLV